MEKETDGEDEEDLELEREKDDWGVRLL